MPDAITNEATSLVAAAALCVGLLAIVAVYESLTDASALGGGDIKLLAVIALFVGFRDVLSFVFLSFSLGILVALAYRLRGERTFPFGPAIALAGAVIYLF